MRKKLKAISLFLTIAISFSACSWFDKNSGDDVIKASEVSRVDTGYPVFFGDFEIKEKPMKIASLSPAITEILVEIGFENIIVLRSDYCDFPESISTIPSGGSAVNANIDIIIEEKPDVLFSYSTFSQMDTNRLLDNGIIPIVFKAPQTLESLSSIYNALGIILYGNNADAEKTRVYFSDKFTSVVENDSNIGKFAYITTGMRVCGNSTFENDFLSFFGENIADSINGYSENLSVFAENEPDILLVSDEFTIEKIKDNEVLKKLKCVKDGNILFMPNGRFEKPSSRLVEIAQLLQ